MVKPRNIVQSRNLIYFVSLYYLAVPVLVVLFILLPTFLYTMCPFLSRCSTHSSWTRRPEENLPSSLNFASELGCSSSRCWAEINDMFGEPVGSVRKVQRWGLGAELELLACNPRLVPGAGYEFEDEVEVQSVEQREENPQELLDISRKKMEGAAVENLCRKVLVENTMKSVQQEINRKIMESFLSF